jgi:hypothetical protein
MIIMSEDILNYYGTSMQIRVGDKIMYPKWFKKVPGTVVYVPGQSPVNKSMEYDDVKQWGIKLDSEPNDIIMLGYFPPDDVVPKRLEFVQRGDSLKELSPDDEIV